MENENKTMAMVKYIFIFFGLVILAGGALYAYENFFKKDEVTVNIKDLEVPGFEGLLNGDKKDPEGDEENIKYVENNCYVEKLIIKSGEKAKLYSRKVVGPYEKCSDFSQERVCNDGFILGNEKFRFSTCRVNTDCQLPDNSLLKNNESIKLYSRKVVPFGETCERYATIRKCRISQLTGDKRFVFKNCKISYNNSCDAGGGNLLANNQTHVFYKRKSVEFGEKCIDYSLSLMCSDAVLQGGNGAISDYKYWSCDQKTAKDCYIDEIKIDHGSSQGLYSKKFGTNSRSCNFYREIRTCTNGVLDGQDEYHYAKCYDN